MHVCLNFMFVIYTAFIESPHDLVTLPEPPTVAPFFCQHSSAHDIVWLVNETSLTQSLPPGISACTITLSYGQILNRVKIETRPEYNGTMVVCVAVFFDGSRAVERTTPAFLILEGT